MRWSRSLALSFLPVALSAAPASSEAPTSEQLAAFRAAKTARIAVQQSYGFARGVSLPFEDVARRMLTYAGKGVLPPGAETADLTVEIRADGEPRASEYRDILGHAQPVRLYTAASVEGSISVTSGGLPPFSRTFAGRFALGQVILGPETDGYAKPSGAPFQQSFEEPGSFLSALCEVVLEVWGPTPLMAALKDEDAALRTRAAETLGKAKAPGALEPLIGALKDRDPAVREKAAEKLGELGDARAVAPLVAALADSETSVGWAAGTALGKIKDPGAAEAAIQALQNPGSKHTRLYAALSLREAKDLRSTPALVAALKDPDPDVRRMALEALGATKDPAALDAMLGMLEDPDAMTRRTAVGFLVAIPEPRAADGLILALKDSNSDVRWTAAMLLGNRREKTAIEPLIATLADTEFRVRTHVADALVKITGQNFGSDAKNSDSRRWRKWWERQQQGQQRRD